MKAKVTKFIDLCRQYMNNNLEHEIDDEIRLFEAIKEDSDGRTLEYHYDLRETVRSFNDYFCIVFLNIANILTYSNETFYEKYLQKSNKIDHDVALKMANKQGCIFCTLIHRSLVQVQSSLEHLSAFLEGIPLAQCSHRAYQA